MAGLFGAFAIQLALRARDRSGRGQVIDIALYDGIFRILDEVAPAFQKGGYIRKRDGAETPIVVPHSHFPTRDERWIAIACTNDRIFGRLTGAMGRPELSDDPRYATNAQRLLHHHAVNGMIADWTVSMDRDEVLDRCSKAEVPCGPVYSIDEIFEDPHYAHRGNILRMQDERVGELAIPNVVPQLLGTPGRVGWLGPPLGSHTDAVLRDVLGIKPDRLADLHARGVV